MKKIVVIGAGSRSNTYCTYFLENPSVGQVVAVAEPNKQRLENFSKRFDIPKENQFGTWEEVLKLPHRIGTTVLIGTMCDHHYEPTIHACRLGYEIILEKPMSIKIDECIDIYRTVTEHNINLAVCHVLRYHPVYMRAKEIISSGILGKITLLNWIEPINRLLYAKSYIRNPVWRHKELDGPLTLAKGCHDFDLIYWILGANDAEIISSMGQKTQFVESMQPQQALGAKKCTECPINNSCPYSALENYGTYKRYRKYVSNRPEATREMAIEDLANGPYDQCVYHSDSDIMEDYVISMKMFNPNFTTLVSMIFSAFHDDFCWRAGTFIGTEATLELSEKNQELKLTYHTKSDGSPGEVQIINCNDIETKSITTKLLGHSGADYYFMENVMKSKNLTSAYDSLVSHILAIDAETARMEGIHWKPKKASRIMNELRILVTTTNPEKIEAVKNMFEYKYNCLCTISGIKCDPGIPDGQPYGIDGTFQGAHQRIVNLGDKINDYDYVVSIENGIATLNTNDKSTSLDFPIVIIMDVHRKITATHFGGSRSIPLDELRMMKKNGVVQSERGKWVVDYYQKLSYSQSRKKLIEDAVLMALEEIIAKD